jgi:hypothetical protein
MITEIIPLDSYQTIYGEIGSSKSIASILSYKEEHIDNPSNTIQIKEIS